MTVKDIFMLRKQGQIEEAYNAIKLNTAVTNIFTAIYYLIEARKYFNNELFKGETNEQ